MTEVHFPCCFCAKRIEQTKVDPCHLAVTTADGYEQWWSCHASCFKAALTRDPVMKKLFEPDHFEEN